MKSLLLALTALTLSVPALAASDAEVAACIERNVPGPDNVRAVRITRSDPRSGSKRIIILRMYGRKTSAGGGDLLPAVADHRRDLSRSGRPGLQTSGDAGGGVERADGPLYAPAQITSGGRFT